jgi:hypothetical protein
MLLGHRYYDASTGRFLTRDPIKDGRNWYVYCENKPTCWVDPTGLVKWAKVGEYVGAAVAVAVLAPAGLSAIPLILIGGGLIYGYSQVGKYIGARFDGEQPNDQEFAVDLFNLVVGTLVKLPDVFGSAAELTDAFVDNMFGPCPIKAYELNEQAFAFSLETPTSVHWREELQRMFPGLQ